MKQPYAPPMLVDYGSITECTFQVVGIPQEDRADGTTTQDDEGLWICTDVPADSHVSGHKNYLELECDKFGEFSHESTSTGS